jgi:predicted ATP-grasp superfamily ATP-dependent carboligase
VSTLSNPVAIINNDWAPTLAFALSLGRQNVPLHFYGSGAGRWSRYCRRRSACPPVEQADRFLPWLQARIRAGEITRLAPTTDLLAYYIAVLREEFPAEVRRAITPLEEIERCLIKTRFSSACSAVGQRVPRTAAPDDPDEAVLAARDLGYPLIIKPKSHLVVGARKRGELVRNEADLRRVYGGYAVAPGQGQLAERYPELRWPLLQRYVPSARRCVYSVSGIKDAGGSILAATLTSKREQWPPDIGVSTVQALCNDERILNAGLKTIDKLISCGIFELELVADGEELLAIDLNPRAFGFMMLDMAVGNDLPWLWWQTTVGAAKSRAASSFHQALECRFILPYYFGHAIRALFGPRDVASGSKMAARGQPWISMVGHRSDPIPMLLAQLRLLRLLPHRGGLVRPFLAAAWRARSAARKRST